MASETFDYRYFVNAPVSQVYEHLARPENYVGLSPLVVVVSDIERGSDAQGCVWVRYSSVERFRFLGLLRYDNLLRVTMTLTNPERRIVSDVDSPFSVKVRFTFDFEPEAGGTWIHETIHAQMPGILRGFVVSEAKRVQLERARILKSRLELSAGE